jgi:AcrR family transcriptional regulator
MLVPRRRQAPERKAEIIAATLRLADADGPDRLTTETIASAVGISQPAVFRHFPTKQALWAAVAEELGARMRARWDAAVAAQADPLLRVRALVEAQLGLIEATPAITAVLFSRELHAANAPLREAFLALMMQLHATLAAAFAAAAAAGRLRSGVAAADAASLVVALLPGLAVRWSLSGKAFPLVHEGLRLVQLQLDALALQADPLMEAGA